MAAGVAWLSWKFNINNIIMSYTANTPPARRCGTDDLRRTREIAFTSVRYTVHKAAVCEWQLIVLSRRQSPPSLSAAARSVATAATRTANRSGMTLLGAHTNGRSPLEHNNNIILFTIFTFRHTGWFTKRGHLDFFLY